MTTTEALAMPMRMYTWSTRRWVAVAHAHSTEDARTLLLAGGAGVGPRVDDSCPVRDEAREYIATRRPLIWSGDNATFALTDSGTIEEQEHALKALREENDQLRENGNGRE